MPSSNPRADRLAPFAPLACGVALLAALAGLLARRAPADALRAQEPADLAMRFERLGQVGGAVSAMAVQGERLYLASGLTVQVYELAGPLAPRLVGQSRPLPDVVRDLDLDGGLAVAALGSGGLAVLGLGDPDQPALLAALPLAGQAVALAVSGPVAYVARGQAGLSVIDLSVPGSPRIVATLSDVPAEDVALDGAVGYVSVGRDGLVKLDVSAPRSPTVRARAAHPSPAHSVQVIERLLYASTDGALYQLDWRQGGDPVHRARAMNVGYGPASTALLGDLVAVADRRMLRLFRLPDAADQGGIMEPVAQMPQEESLYGRPALVASAGRLYLASPPSELRVVEASFAGGLRVASQRPLVGVVSKVAAEGANAVAFEGYPGPRTIDLRRPELPSLTGAFTTTRPVRTGLIHRAVAYLSGVMGQLTVVDLRVPGQAMPLTQVDWRPAVDLVGSGDHVFASAGELAVIDVTDPSRPGFPALSWQGEPAAGLTRLSLDQDWLFSAPWDGGYPILVDVADPLRPKRLQVGGAAPRGGVVDLSARESRLHLVYDVELKVMDSLDPLELADLGRLTLPGEGSVVGLAQQGDRLLVTRLSPGAGPAELLAIDVADPGAPRLLARWQPGTRLGEVAASGEVAVVAAFDGGLQTLRLAADEPSATPTAGPTPRASMSLGDQVFRDLDNDARFEPLAGESGIGRVPLRLYRDDGSGTLDSADGAPVRVATSEPVTGGYRFTALTAGDYLLEVDRAAFAPGGALDGMETSFGLTGGRSADPDDDVDHDDNGNGFSGSGVTTFAITLIQGGEPVDDGDGADGNLTLDLGFSRAGEPTPTWTATGEASPTPVGPTDTPRPTRTPLPTDTPTITPSPTPSPTPSATPRRELIHLPFLVQRRGGR